MRWRINFDIRAIAARLRIAFGTSAFANTLSIVALLLAGYSLHVSDRTEARKDVRELRRILNAADRQTLGLGGEILMSAAALLANNPSEECRERGKFLLEQANALIVVGSGGREVTDGEFDRWAGLGRTPEDENDDGETFKAMIERWTTDAVDAQAFGTRFLRYTAIVVEHCKAGQLPPPFPDEIQEEMRKRHLEQVTR